MPQRSQNQHHSPSWKSCSWGPLRAGAQLYDRHVPLRRGSRESAKGSIRRAVWAALSLTATEEQKQEKEQGIWGHGPWVAPGPEGPQLEPQEGEAITLRPPSWILKVPHARTPYTWEWASELWYSTMEYFSAIEKFC